MFIKKLFILITIGKVYSFDFTFDDFKSLAAVTVPIISSVYCIHHFKKINEEKKLFGDYYRYKGKIKELIENCHTEPFKNTYGDELEKLKKNFSYNIKDAFYWQQNQCGDGFLEDFITTTLKATDENTKKRYKKFFLNGFTNFNDYIEKNIKDNFLSPTNKHSWFQNNFPGAKLVAINNNGKEESITLPAGKISKYKEVLDSLPGKIISDEKDNIIKKIQEDFSLIKKIMLEEKYSAKFSFPMYILHGDPGTGKTIRIKELFLKLCESIEDKEKDKCLYITLKSSDILDKYVGESEKKISAFFDSIIKMGKIIENNGFILVHIDEIESLTGSRDNTDQKEWTKNIVNLILTGVDDLRSKGFPVLILGSTNNANQIDGAIQRAGRLKLIKIEKPTQEEKQAIIDYYETYFNGKTFNIELTEEEKNDILNNSKTGADIRKAVEKIFLERLKKDYQSCKIGKKALQEKQE